jgi:hypothetical protein
MYWWMVMVAKLREGLICPSLVNNQKGKPLELSSACTGAASFFGASVTLLSVHTTAPLPKYVFGCLLSLCSFVCER